jgi:hypothetical protein
VINQLPPDLYEALLYLDPSPWFVECVRHSDEAYTLWLQDRLGNVGCWRASLSLDDRWTLSPVRNKSYTGALVVDPRSEG